ncbi:MAG: hypothetical protein IH614_20615 [Desulfuromonadales bacterium]|nr:hypothetical protein [Desulfuromonadales bacterium]
MKRVAALLAALALWLPAQTAVARGTPAGTSISNQASVSYTMETTEIKLTSNAVTLEVAELIDLELVWQDAENVVVQPGVVDKVLIFRLHNTGNGQESFLLLTDNLVDGNQFQPDNPRIYLDTDGDGLFDPALDLPYHPESNRPALGLDASMTLFVLNDIPDATLDGYLGSSRLTATAVTGSGPPGTAFPGKGDGGVNAVIGSSQGTSAIHGTYQASRLEVIATKSATVSDPFGGTEPVPGATIAYRIAVAVSGTGIASGVGVRDPIPDGTTYTPNTLTLDGTSLTDGADDDEGEIAAGAVTVRLGDLQGMTRTVTFRVTID